MGRNEENEEQYRLALGKKSKIVNPYTINAALLRDMGRNKDAEELYKLGLEAYPNDANTYSDYGILLYEMGRNKEAEEQFKLALKIDSKHANSLYNYGTILYEMGRDAEAEEYFKLAVEENPNDAAIHYNYGNLLLRMKSFERAEEQYKLAVEVGPNNAVAHYNYGTFLSEIGRYEEAEKEFKLTLKENPNYVGAYCNYGIVLKNIGRYEEAEKQFKLALKEDLKHVYTHHNYGRLLNILGRYGEAEEQYKLALEATPNDSNIHYDYALILVQMKRIEEAEDKLKSSISLNPNMPEAHAVYSFLLIFKDLEEAGIEEMEIASRIFRENGDVTREHLCLAWIYEQLANKYYISQKYQESGQYADMSGNEFIEASKHAGEDFKKNSLTKGYTLKGRAEIRKLDLPDLQLPYNIKTLTKIIKGIYHASEFYKKAAEVSPEDNQICNACSLSMRCLSEILDYMFALIEPEPKKIIDIKAEIKRWKEELANCEKIYKENEKGKNFIQSLHKLIDCSNNFSKYNESAMLIEKIVLEDCIRELIDISNRIEGPLQKIIEDSAKQIDQCKEKIIPHKGIETKSFSEIVENRDLESMHLNESIIKTKKSVILKRIFDYRKVAAITMIFLIFIALFSLVSKIDLISLMLTKFIPTKDNSYIFIIFLSTCTFLFGSAIIPKFLEIFKRKE